MSIIKRIADAYPAHVASWVKGGAEPMPIELSFYRQFVLVQVKNDLSESEYKYVVGDNNVIHLDGGLDTILSVNQADNLCLMREEVPAYLRFVFAHVGKSKLSIVEETSDIHWVDKMPGDRMAMNLIDSTNDLVQPIQTSDLVNGKYTVRMIGIFVNNLVVCEIEVAPDGGLYPLNQKILLEGIPVRC
jgi:hypothetical protein